MTETKPEASVAFVDGRDALAYVIIRPNGAEGVVIEAQASGISKRQAALVLRHVADQWDAPAAVPAVPADGSDQEAAKEN